MGSGRLATEYAQTRGRKVSDIMTSEVRRVTEDALLEEVVHLMGRHQINRVLVVRDGKLVGIVTRANLLHALASVAAETKPGPTSDTSIRERLYAELKAQPWAPVGLINVVVRNGVVHLSGTLLDERHRGAIRVAAERIPGVKAVEDRLVWVDPVSGMVVPALNKSLRRRGKPPDDRANGGQCDSSTQCGATISATPRAGLPTPQADKAPQKMPIRSMRSASAKTFRKWATKCLCERSSTFQCSRQSMNARFFFFY